MNRLRYDFTGQKAAAAVELNWGAEQPGAYDGVDDAAAGEFSVATRGAAVLQMESSDGTDQ